MKVQKEEQ